MLMDYGKRGRKVNARRRLFLRLIGVFALTVFLGLMISTERFVAFGGVPDEASLARIHASPHFDRTKNEFVNTEATGLMKVSGWESGKHWMFGDEQRVPPCTLPVVSGGLPKDPPASGLRVTWLGHSTTLVEIDGARVLTDPNWSERSSPSRWVGPKRFHPPPIAIADLPPIDAVVISHEHFDHLDMSTIRALAARGTAFHVALGVGAHLLAWGVPRDRVFEHDWWERATIAPGVSVVSTPARHFNGRGIPWRLGALWTSWAIEGPGHRVYFSGDTGLEQAFREIAQREGPFDVVMLEIGQFHEDWGDIHLGPKGALEGTKMLGAKRLLPVHWGTFNLAYHAWDDPIETVTHEANANDVTVLTPRLGQPIEPTTDPKTEAWWKTACP